MALQAEVNDPFSQDDIRRMLELESERNSKEHGWELVSKNDNVEVLKKEIPGSPVNLVKGYLYLPNVPPEAVLEMLTDLSVRKRWDKQFPVMEVLEEHDNHDIIYWQSKMPPGVTDRDAVQVVTKRWDEAEGAWFIMNKSTEHKSKPPPSGLVRAETILSGSIICADEKDPSSTHLCVLLQNDAKGLIPTVIVNLFQSHTPENWHDSLYNYNMNEYTAQCLRVNIWRKVKRQGLSNVYR